MNRCLLALVLSAVSCGPAAPFELPPLGKRPGPVRPTPEPVTPVDQGVRGLPCEVRTVLEAHCTGCHAGQTYTRHLTRLEEFRYDANQGKTVGDEMVERLTTASRSAMPPEDAQTRPTPAEALVLINWVTSGMPEGSCGEAVGH